MPEGTLIGALSHAGRRVRVTPAHTATVEVRAGGRRVAKRRLGPCGRLSKALPKAAKSAQIVARYGKRIERRRLRLG